MSGASAKQSYDLEQEKMLPGVVMASGGQVFDMLYRLADLDESKLVDFNSMKSIVISFPLWIN